MHSRLVWALAVNQTRSSLWSVTFPSTNFLSLSSMSWFACLSIFLVLVVHAWPLLAKDLEGVCSLERLLPKIHWITQYYEEKKPFRRAELQYAFCMNLLNSHVDKIHILHPLDETPVNFSDLASACASYGVPVDLITKKVVYYQNADIASGFLRLGDAMVYAGKNCQNDVAVISNADIYFDDSLLTLKRMEMQSKDLATQDALYFLSRYERNEKDSVGTQCSLRYRGSHDTLIYIPRTDSILTTKLPEKVMVSMGTYGIENALFNEASALGMVLI